MKVAFLTLSHNTGMYYGLIRMFRDNGHEITVFTPTYEGKNNIVTKDGIRILNFKSLPMLNIGIIRKGIANLLFPFLSVYGAKQLLKKDNKFDLILSTTPPIAFYKLVSFLKKTNTKAIFYLILRDIHPEGAKFVGLHKYKLIYNYFRSIERKLYSLADYIGCMSPGNIHFIEDRNPELNKGKLRELPNWENCVKYSDPISDIKTKYQLENKFIVIYGGNMGIPQGLDIVLELAAAKKHLKDVLFLFVGKGTERRKLEDKAKEMDLENVRFMDFIPREDYNDLIKISDIGLISLHKDLPIPNIPSKTLGYFVNKVPILASIDFITDYGEYIIETSNSGLWSYATDLEKLSSNFDTLYEDNTLRKNMGENGYQYFLRNFTTDKAYNEIMESYYSKNGY